MIPPKADKPYPLWPVFVRWLLVASAIIIAALVFRSNGLMGVNWSFPYFSGAANFESLYDWKISPSEYAKVMAMSISEQMAYRYVATDETIGYSYNDYGYVLVALVARHIFWWMGDIDSVVVLQIIIHVVLSLTTLVFLRSTIQRTVFFFAFSVNPLVIHIVTLPFYYFWTAIPSFIFIFVWFRGCKPSIWVWPIAGLCFFSFLVRPTTIFVCLLVFAVILLKERRVVVFAGLTLFLGFSIHSHAKSRKSPWHTMYIGIGAYENPYMPSKPLDSNGYAYYERITGRTVSTNAISGIFNDPESREHYDAIMRSAYWDVARESPVLLVRNAVFNTLQAFSLGYDADRKWVQFASAITGLLMIGLIVWARQWIWGVGIIAVAGSFMLYFPPIPAYLFGAYPFTVLAASGIMEALWRRLLAHRG
jgi:hypothetical protein